MVDQDFINRIDNVNEIVTWPDVGFEKNKGTVNCPFCGSKGKGYLYDNYFKCFSSKCGEKGNKINIHQKLNNYTFYEALLDLESIGSIDLEAHKEFVEVRNDLLSMVVEVYANELKYYDEGLEYLNRRGFKTSFIEQEQIGYARHSSILKSYNLDINNLRRHDLIRNKQDFFQNRFIFPVYNTKGYLVHLTGRHFPGECDQYKYLDSAAMPNIGSCKDYLLFEKHLGLYQANKKPLFLVEGVPDSYILKQAGANVVGLMGLRKLLKQGVKLQNFSEVIAIFDNDRFEDDHPNFPGEFKSWRVVLDQLVDLQIYLGSSVVIKTAMIPEGLQHKDSYVKDINDFYLYLENNDDQLIKELKGLSSDIVATYINVHKGNLNNHRTALKLITAASRGSELLTPYIPNDWTPIQYALKVLGG